MSERELLQKVLPEGSTVEPLSMTALCDDGRYGTVSLFLQPSVTGRYNDTRVGWMVVREAAQGGFERVYYAGFAIDSHTIRPAQVLLPDILAEKQEEACKRLREVIMVGGVDDFMEEGDPLPLPGRVGRVVRDLRTMGISA